MNLGKILIVDDIEDLREIAIFYFETLGSCTFLQASSGDEAIKLLHENPDITIVLCDYNMPQGNGGKVAVELRKTRKIPFILNSTDMPADHAEFATLENIFHAPKPLTIEILTEVINKALPNVQPSGRELTAHVSVNLRLLEMMKKVPCPIYVQLADNKFVKTHHAGTEIPSDDLVKYKERGLKHLFIERADLQLFIQEFQKFVKETLSVTNLKGNNLHELATNALDLVSSVQSHIGVTPEVQNLTEKNIDIVLKLASKNDGLQNIFDTFKESGSRYSQHCVTTALIATAIGKKLGWLTAQNSAKMAFAALLHDAALTTEEWENSNETRGLTDRVPERQESEQARNFIAHPGDGADLARKFVGCPADVDEIVSQHHEKPDGTGFPVRIPAQKIMPLAAVFILSHHLAMDLIASKGKLNLVEWIRTYQDYYALGNFKKVLDNISL